jgi:hypothetical protein
MFAAGRMVLRGFLGLHGTLVAVSALFMMPLCDSDIPMNVPFTFSNKQPLLHPVHGQVLVLFVVPLGGDETLHEADDVQHQ